MGHAGKLIGELLVEAKALSSEKLEEALKIPRVPGRKLGQVLIEAGLVTEAQVTQALSLQLSVPWVSLYHIDFSRQLLNRVPRELAEKHCLVPIFVRHVKGQGDTMYVAIEDPANEAGLADAGKAVGLPVRPMIASPSDIRSALRVYYGTPEEPVVSPEPPAPDASAPRDGRKGEKAEPPPLPPSRRMAPATAMSAETHAKPEAPATQPGRESGRPAVPPARDAPARPDSKAPPSQRPDGPSEAPELEVGRSISVPPRKGPRMVSLTLLDGTAIQVPARPSTRHDSVPPSAGGMSDQLTARDLVSALRAVSHGADASEVLGEKAQLEAMFAALLSLLLRKGLIADWEFVEEIRKI